MSTENKIYFSDFFEVTHKSLETYGALDISLICDNPAFVDPFLIFANPDYKKQHEQIISYLKFLRDKSLESRGSALEDGDFKHYYKFPEVKEAWLGFSVDGNSGLGLGKDFADSLYKNLNEIFSDFGREKVTQSAHLEKLCLVEKGIGIDKISDFTLNLIKNFILEYTQEYAQKNISSKYVKEFAVNKALFNHEDGIWEGKKYKLPFLPSDPKNFVLLVPQNILTKESTWISRSDFLENSSSIFSVIDNAELRSKLNKFFIDNLLIKLDKHRQPSRDYSKKSTAIAFTKTIKKYPEVIDYYIKLKETGTKEALDTHVIIADQVNFFGSNEVLQEAFMSQKHTPLASLTDCIGRIKFFKDVIESNSNSINTGKSHLSEKTLQLMFKMTTRGSLFDYNSEVNNGRGPIDFIVSLGATDKIGLELKLASSSKLKQNLAHQADAYAKDSKLMNVIKIIFYFTTEELNRVNNILREIGKSEDNEDIFLIDCRKKESASNIKYKKV